jgi:predicted ATPase/DNA-binding CsgD family transcriptional regulator/transcriptional regulator with XRE-family HTH domain
MAEQATLGFAGLLRQLRAEAELTQQELAKAAGLSPRAVSDLERGINRTARKDTAVRLAGALGLAEPVRSVFVSAALGRIQAAQVLAARRQAQGRSLAPAGGMHGFVPALTSFVGRAGPVSEVAALLGCNRLVTVTGPGGAGKSRLAGQVAGQVAGRFADGVWLAALAPVHDPVLVAVVVAAALGVREQPGLSAAGALARALARQQLLLVLDNCEHVIGAAAELCAGLLAACDDVRVLATSREPLRTAGEARYRLGPLGLPGPDDLADVARAEAVALFAGRARQVNAQFALDDQAIPMVARLVRRLDGMPLAIELAAARVEALGVRQLLDRIDDRFALLVAGDRVAADRQRSLAATVEWSYRLLDDRERVFRAVSVFPAGFTLEAAEAVAGPGVGPAVLRLVDCSLLSPPQAGPDGRLRYVMLETLRAYGAGLLAGAGEQDGAAVALAGYALGVAEQAAAGLQTSTGEVAAARWLDAEDATTRKVLAWARDRDAGMALRFACALAPWWFLRGRLVGQYTVLYDAVRHTIPGDNAWCAAQYWLGQAALYSADLTRALSRFTAVRDVLCDRLPSQMLVDCLAGRSRTLVNLLQITEAVDDGRRALAMARELSYPAGEALALADLSIVAFITDHLGEAVHLARQARQISADVPSWIGGWCSNNLSQLLTTTGDLATAKHICAAGLPKSRDVGDSWTQMKLLIQIAMLEQMTGRIDDAAAHLREALHIIAQTNCQFEMTNVLDCCGHLCAATGRHAEAVTIWAARTTLAQKGGWGDDAPAAGRHRDEVLRVARQALGAAQAHIAENRGKAMSMNTAAEYALMLTSPSPSPAAAATPGQLSARERQLVTLVAQGRTNAQIAAQLYVSIRTVTSHLDRIRDKTGCRRRADLTRLALSERLI